MFTHHTIEEKDSEQILYLHIDYNFEIGSFNKMKKSEKHNIYNQVKDYINTHKIDFKGHVVYLVLNGIIIGSILFNGPNIPIKENNSVNYNYVGQVSSKFKLDKIPSEQNEVIKEVVKEKPKTDAIKEKETKVEPKPSVVTPKTTTKTAPKTEIKVEPKKEEPNETVKPPAEKVEEPKEEISQGVMVTLYRSTGVVITIPLEDYIVGVVGAEMPASFHSEALKAQSVAARTYALKMIKQNKVLTDTTAHQVYKDNDQLKSMWGSSFDTYYNKIKNSVLATNGEYLTYNNVYIDAVYHSTNNGKTESSVDVFGNYYPYLISVDSHWDTAASSYLRETTKDFNTVNTLLGIDANSDSLVEIISKTSGGSIDVIKIDDNSFTGTDIRQKLGLRSADFDMVIGETGITFVTRGYGHGVGMSQYGANGMAKDGYGYKAILSHYYPGTSINKI